VKSIIFSKPLVKDGKERAIILNAPLSSSDIVINVVLAFSVSNLLAGYILTIFSSLLYDFVNLYVYVDNNPLKYIDPTGHVKVTSVNMDVEDYEIDILSPIRIRTYPSGKPWG
jgi:hypothetical protein